MSIFITTSIYTQLLTFAFEVAEMTTYIYGQHTLLLLLPASIQAEARESWELFSVNRSLHGLATVFSKRASSCTARRGAAA